MFHDTIALLAKIGCFAIAGDSKSRYFGVIFSGFDTRLRRAIIPAGGSIELDEGSAGLCLISFSNGIPQHSRDGSVCGSGVQQLEAMLPNNACVRELAEGGGLIFFENTDHNLGSVIKTAFDNRSSRLQAVRHLLAEMEPVTCVTNAIPKIKDLASLTTPFIGVHILNLDVRTLRASCPDMSYTVRLESVGEISHEIMVDATGTFKDCAGAEAVFKLLYPQEIVPSSLHDIQMVLGDGYHLTFVNDGILLFHNTDLVRAHLARLLELPHLDGMSLEVAKRLTRCPGFIRPVGILH